MDSITSTSKARAIIRCTAKGCRRAHVADFTTTATTTAHDGRPYTSRAVQFNGREALYRDRHDLARIIGSGFECTSCGGRYASFDIVQGSFSESVKCGARCRNAVGADCECNCSGENHGSAHVAI